MYPFQDETLASETRINDLLERLTLEEKFLLMSGYRIWWTHPIKRLEIPRMGMSDGPNGISFHSSYRRNTQFPVTKCQAASWNRELLEQIGIAIADEVRAVKKHILLAPGINIDRTPLNGRTFEYFSEDPFLTQELTKPFVKGVQSRKIAACIKHYVANNQETNRRLVNAIIDERTLHEIYMHAFEDVVRNADPWSIMGCYNKVNGTYGCENEYNLQKTLFEKWGFTGFVMSDWWATHSSSTDLALKAGLTLEMPKMTVYKPDLLKRALDERQISEDRVNELLKKMIRVMVTTGVFDKESSKGSRNTPEHQKLAQKIAEEGIVLLKNDGILPLEKNKHLKIAILGRNAKKKMGKFLYGGSSAVVPPFEITPYNGIAQRSHIDIVKKPEEADFVLFCTGLNHGKYEDSEGFDRKQLELPKEEEELLLETQRKNPKTIVILINGSPIAMDKWLDKIPVVVEAWFPGMMGGKAIANVIFGDVNPSGKLPITFPKKIEDSPAHRNLETFPGEEDVKYEEGIYVGYRYFDKYQIEPLFPFGFGLSYTSFEITSCIIDQDFLHLEDIINVNVGIKNTGAVPGAEVVQVYATDIEASVDRPLKELVGFSKIYLEPDEKKTTHILIKVKDLAFYDRTIHNWKIEPGKFKLLIGTSSRSIRYEKIITIG